MFYYIIRLYTKLKELINVFLKYFIYAQGAFKVRENERERAFYPIL